MSQNQNTRGNIRAWLAHNYNVTCDICGRKRKRTECLAAYGTGTLPIVISCRDGCADKLQIRNFPDPIVFDNKPVRDARPPQSVNVPASSYYIPSQFKWGKSMPGYWGGWNLPNDIGNTNGICTWGNMVGIRQDAK